MRTFPPPEPAEIPPDLDPASEDEPGMEVFVAGSPRGEDRLGLVLKRTYVIRPDGWCELAEEDEQDVVIDEELPYDDVEPPFVSPVMYGCDTLAFREMTDLVVQGSAFTYGEPVLQTTVRVRVREWYREILVHGDRLVELVDGRPRFGPPEPFQEMPIRYEKAYGGVDVGALERNKTEMLEDLVKARPELGLDTATPYHYPRNPAGMGFRIDLDDESLDGLVAPNLEYAFDPVTPERLAVGHEDLWFRAPLPACMDWQGATWFPRIGYVGGTPLPEGAQVTLAEVEYGWVSPDLLQIPRMDLEQPMRPEFTQAASAGMAFPYLGPDETIDIHNMHPLHPRLRVRLPGEVPVVGLGLGVGGLTQLTPHLNAVVIRPDADEVVMIWCAQTPVSRGYTADQVAGMDRRVEWYVQG